MQVKTLPFETKTALLRSRKSAAVHGVRADLRWAEVKWKSSPAFYQIQILRFLALVPMNSSEWALVEFMA